MDTINQDTRTIVTRYTRSYKIALGLIAVLVILGQLLLQRLINAEAHNIELVSKTGKQRFFSQQITKILLILGSTPTSDRKVELANAIASWSSFQTELFKLDKSVQFGHLLASNAVQGLIMAQKPYYDVIFKATEKVVQGANQPDAQYVILTKAAATQVLSAELYY